MLDTIATRRRGHTRVNNELDHIIGETIWLTTSQLADLIERDGITGTPDTTSAGPVGLWVVGELAAAGVPAVFYTWVGTLCVYGPGRFLLGEVRIPETHPMHELECEVNDLDRPELLHQGEGDHR